jgi:glycosyltransferase involved in cell wall biosynthesis
MEDHLHHEQVISTPQVTVLMGVFNGAAYLRHAVDSILAQTFQDFEFLIINDGSTDDSRAILRSYADRRIRVIENEENIGLTRSLNRGLRLARADLIARQDADDVSHPARLEKQVAFMEANPEIVVVGTQARYINSRGGLIRVGGWNKLRSEFGVRWELMFNSPFVHTSVMFRHSVVWQIEGGYNESFITSQDFELWSRLSRRYRMCNLPDSLVDLRLHQDSMSANYSTEKVAKVGQVLRDNLQMNLPSYQNVDEWINIWLGLNNPRVHSFCASGNDVLKHLKRIYEQFLSIQPEGIESIEIRKHLAGLLLRASFATLRADLGGSLLLVGHAAHYDFVAVIMAIPKLFVRILQRFFFSCLSTAVIK